MSESTQGTATSGAGDPLPTLALPSLNATPLGLNAGEFQRAKLPRCSICTVGN